MPLQVPPCANLPRVPFIVPEKLRPFIETRDLLWSVQDLFRRSDRAEERLRLVLEADLR